MSASNWNLWTAIASGFETRWSTEEVNGPDVATWYRRLEQMHSATRTMICGTNSAFPSSAYVCVPQSLQQTIHRLFAKFHSCLFSRHSGYSVVPVYSKHNISAISCFLRQVRGLKNPTQLRTLAERLKLCSRIYESCSTENLGRARLKCCSKELSPMQGVT